MENELNFNCWYEQVCINNLDTHCTHTSSCVRYLEMKYLMDTSGIPKSRQIPTKLVPEESDYTAFCELADWKDDVVYNIKKGKNLYIGSHITGNGKTSWAIKLMLKYFNEIWAGNGFKQRGAFIYVPTFLAKLKDFNTIDSAFEELKANITDIDLVIWDDIGSANLSNYDLSQMCNYIDQRIIGGKSNIFTGNLLDANLERALGNRLYSRIWNTSQKVIFTGADRRN